MRTDKAGLNNLLFGQTRGKILATLYDWPEESFYVRQLARHIAGSAGTVQRELTTLSAAGLILKARSGNQVLYRANCEHPVFPELRSLLKKTVGVVHVLGTALATLAADIEFAFIYGSIARGEENADSDIDLMVVGEVTLDDLLAQLSPIERNLSRQINPTVYAREELRTRLRAGNHFLKAIQSAQLTFLIGNENEFRAIR